MIVNYYNIHYPRRIAAVTAAQRARGPAGPARGPGGSSQAASDSGEAAARRPRFLSVK